MSKPKKTHPYRRSMTTPYPVKKPDAISEGHSNMKLLLEYHRTGNKAHLDKLKSDTITDWNTFRLIANQRHNEL